MILHDTDENPTCDECGPIDETPEQHEARHIAARQRPTDCNFDEVA